MKDCVFTEAIIQDLLWRHLPPREWVVPNVHHFEWESDLLTVLKSGRTEEYEIKCSRSDFLADQKKVEKMEALTTGIITRTVYDWQERRHKPVRQEKVRRPNRFTYVTAAGVATAEDIPAFAGWIELRHDGTSSILRHRKKAPLLHSEKVTYGTLAGLGRKMMYRYWDGRRRASQLEARIEQLKTIQMEKP